MKVKLLDKSLERLFTSEAHKLKLPVSVISSAQRKIAFMQNCNSELDLRNWKSLHYEALAGDKKGLKSIRLNDQWRLVFKLVEKKEATEIHLLSVEDYH